MLTPYLFLYRKHMKHTTFLFHQQMAQLIVRPKVPCYWGVLLSNKHSNVLQKQAHNDSVSGLWGDFSKPHGNYMVRAPRGCAEDPQGGVTRTGPGASDCESFTAFTPRPGPFIDSSPRNRDKRTAEAKEANQRSTTTQVL